jgi:hypothetical protein
MMATIRGLWQTARIVFFTLAGWLTLCSVAWAQLPKKDEGPKLNSSTYVMAYMLVIFGVALGMLLVCRSSNRRERAKPEQFGESKTAAEKAAEKNEKEEKKK